MAKIAAYLLVGIGVGLGFAYWQGFGRSDGSLESGLTAAERAPLERRLSELETSLALERYERQALADEIEALMATFTVSVDEPGSDGTEAVAARRDDDDGDWLLRERFPDGRPQSREEMEQFMQQRQIQRFVDAGLPAERAQWIMQREDELAMEVLQARYDATQAGASAEEVANLSTSQLLRKELGDAEYEKYLEGRGRPTTINVNEVLTNSPAQAAGLQSGDEIVGYNGKRVFEMSELNRLTYESRPGGSVALDVIRDGQRMQVFVESGPIGIQGGGRSRRRGGFR